MPDGPIEQLGGRGMQQQVTCQVGPVSAVFCTLDLASVRIVLFENLIFARGQSRTEYDVPDKSVRNTLLNEAAFQILAFLWKESDYVDSSELPLGVYKQFPKGPISQLGLAKKMASSIDDLGRMNSTVRNVAIAGYMYGLVGRKSLDQTHVEIFGTELLHKLMVAYRAEFLRVIQAALTNPGEHKSGAGL